MGIDLLWSFLTLNQGYDRLINVELIRQSLLHRKSAVMIKKIEAIKNLGIFRDFKADKSLNEFTTFNLIYGWNGSGKSTLAKLFSSIEEKKMNADFPTAEFKIQVDNVTITEANLSGSSINIKVFDQDFIAKNIDWNTSVKSILILAEDKIEDRKKFDQLNPELFLLKNNIDKAQIQQSALSDKINDFYSKSAKLVKEAFKIIDTSDKYYFNYDRTKFKQFIETKKTEINKPTSILSEADRQNIVASIKPIEKPEVNISIEKPQKEKFIEAKNKIAQLLSQDVVTKTIERLKENLELNNWVKHGLEIHTKLDSINCEFCGQILPAQRIEDLRNHFNEAYLELTQKLGKAKEWLDTIVAADSELPDTLIFYDEFQDTYLKNKTDIESTRKKLGLIIQQWKEQINLKLANVFAKLTLADDKLEETIDLLEEITVSLTKLVEQHNLKTKNFSKEIKDKKEILELHYAADAVQKSELKNWSSSLTKAEENLKSFRAEQQVKITEANRLEASLSNEAKGADEFNKFLHRFLGRRDILLKFDSRAKGYSIIREPSGEKAKNLSEGEKTAIAFVYFVIKLKEKGNKCDQTIIVVDDPISSFDSNHLFHSYSFLKSECEKAEQLFILTHNFQYYRIIRDWLANKNKEKKDGSMRIKTRFFCIETTATETREANVKNAHETLQKYNSEYHYVFYRLHQLKDEPMDSLDKAYLIGNLSRKLLEGFLAFKYPKARNDFKTHFDYACNGLIDGDVSEKVFRFINKYSHNQLIEFHDTPIDNLLAEGSGVVREILMIVEKIDEKHYSEMSELCLII